MCTYYRKHSKILNCLFPLLWKQQRGNQQLSFNNFQSRRNELTCHHFIFFQQGHSSTNANIFSIVKNFITEQEESLLVFIFTILSQNQRGLWQLVVNKLEASLCSRILSFPSYLHNFLPGVTVQICTVVCI